VLVDVLGGFGGRCEYATTLGAGGLFVESDDPLPAGTRIRARFRLPGGAEVHEIEGRVAWRIDPGDAKEGAHAPGMGVEFNDPVATSRLARELDGLP
jgi:uncharacterized protein (TIGR02266 family)